MYTRSFSKGNLSRREWIGTTAAAAGVVAAASTALSAATNQPPLGMVTSVRKGSNADKVIARVRQLGFTTCQIGMSSQTDQDAADLRSALDKYQVKATAFMELGPGPMVWDFYHGPLTIGLVPPATRAARIAALKHAADFAQKAGIPAIQSHCGFIPSNPNEQLYKDVVAAIREVASHLKERGCMLLCETGQETPVTLLRAITDVGLDNVGVNLDVANLILYGNGNPVDALDVIGKYVHGMHAKDGLYPTDPRNLGKEVAIGKGKVDFRAVFKGLKALNYTNAVTIEREISGPEQTQDIQASKSYLERLLSEAYG
jgi:L-ribulose-5-phosphate 3-epimerase